MIRDILIIILLLCVYGLLIKVAWRFFVRPLLEIMLWVLATAFFTISLPVKAGLWVIRQCRRRGGAEPPAPTPPPAQSEPPDPRAVLLAQREQPHAAT